MLEGPQRCPIVTASVRDTLVGMATNVGRVDDDSQRPSLLTDHALTDEERAAHDEEPRTGIVPQAQGAFSEWAGGKLTQDATDTLIRTELLSLVRAGERAEVLRAIGGDPSLVFIRSVFHHDKHLVVSYQRGGIDSDPLVRLLAYRAWGDRDQRWFDGREPRNRATLRAVPHAAGDRATRSGGGR
jgi:hypothetical protein